MCKPYVYAYQLSYNGIIQYKQFQKKRKNEESEQERNNRILSTKNNSTNRKHRDLQNETDSKQKKGKYKLNKSKTRARVTAFSRLPKSRKNFYFYTISFPNQLPDNQCFDCLNIALTRLRKDAKIQDYLWITERQKNNTLHFHLLTNDVFSVIELNSYVKASLKTKVRNKEFDYNFEVIQKYNGVDIAKNRTSRKVINLATQKDKKQIISYLTKYISKNNELFTKLPFHSSHSISKLTSKVKIDEYESLQLWDLYQKNNPNPRNYKNDIFCISFFSTDINDEIFTPIDRINEILYRPRQSSKGTSSPAYFCSWA